MKLWQRTTSCAPPCSADHWGSRQACNPAASRTARPSGSGLGSRDEQVQPQPLRKEPGDKLPLDAVAGLVEQRRKRPQPALARGDRDDAAANAALARQPDVVQPVAG